MYIYCQTLKSLKYYTYFTISCFLIYKIIRISKSIKDCKLLKYYNNLNFLLYSLVGPLIELDHIAISGRTLEEASDYIESRLGVKVQDGGCHDRYGTHNKLLGLTEGIYLEAIAVNPAAKKFYQPRWFNLDNFDYEPRITNWICRSKNIKNAVKNLSFE